MPPSNRFLDASVIKSMGSIMQAKKMILETDRQGRLVNQPKLPPNVRMEAIFLIPEKKRKSKKRRRPSPVIAGKGKIIGDIISPVSPPEDWDVLQ